MKQTVSVSVTVLSILPRFRRILPATRGLIAAPWTPLASLCSAWGQRSGVVSCPSIPSPEAARLCIHTGSRVGSGDTSSPQGDCS